MANQLHSTTKICSDTSIAIVIANNPMTPKNGRTISNGSSNTLLPNASPQSNPTNPPVT